MRTLTLLLILTTVHLTAATLVRDDVVGRWQLDMSRVTDAQRDAANGVVEGFGITLTSRIGRVTWSADDMVAGMWRIDDATETTATLVISTKSGTEHHYHLTINGDQMNVTEAPHGLPLARAGAN